MQLEQSLGKFSTTITGLNALLLPGVCDLWFSNEMCKVVRRAIQFYQLRRRKTIRITHSKYPADQRAICCLIHHHHGFNLIDGQNTYSSHVNRQSSFLKHPTTLVTLLLKYSALSNRWKRTNMCLECRKKPEPTRSRLMLAFMNQVSMEVHGRSGIPHFGFLKMERSSRDIKNCISLK